MFFVLLISITLANPNTVLLPGDAPPQRWTDPVIQSQIRPLMRRLHTLYSPTIGFPAVVDSGKQFAIWSARRIHKAVLVPADNCAEAVSLEFDSAQSQGDDRLWRTVVRVPVMTPRAFWDLEITWEDGTLHREPLAVRVLGGISDTEDFRIAVMTDHQLRDPSWELGKTALAPRNRPKHGEKKDNLAITQQIFHELRLLDPDMVVHLGDLLFGLDFSSEYSEMFKRISQSQLVSFYIPGNHDAYATYSIQLPKLGSVSVNLLACKSKIPKNLDFNASWVEIWGFLSCMYSGLKEELFDHLVIDGLEQWKALIGPVNTSFVRGRFHFIFLNTYGGTARRRHSFSVYREIFDRFLGAPMVDNYGGTLSEEDLSFVQKELNAAVAAGRTPVIFGHHDPRGNMHQTPYHRNEPFPTDPVGINHFEEWNYDDEWDSDPTDGRGKETAFENSGVRLVRMLAKTGGYYISGHVHKDEQWTYGVGDRIGRDVVVEKPLVFIKVTTASAATKDDSVWGYRLFTARADGTLSLEETVPGHLSVPAGNFWVNTYVTNGKGEVHTFNALPKPVDVRLSFCVPFHPAGYRFTDAHGRRLELVDTSFSTHSFSRFVYRIVLPAGQRSFQQPERVDAVLMPVMGNRPPEIRWLADGRPIVLRDGDTVEAQKLDASPTHDPDGDPLAQAHFLSAGRVIPGFVWSDGPADVVFAVRDHAGAWSRMALRVTSRTVVPGHVRSRGAHGCGCNCRISPGPVPLLSLGILLGLTFFLRRRLGR